MKHRKVFGSGRFSFMGAFVAMTLMAPQTGCAPVKAPMRAVSAPSQAPPARSEMPSQESLPGLIVTEIEGKKEPEKLYSFSLREANIQEVLLAISKQTTFNIVVDPDVQGTVTLDLKDVSLTEALDTLTDLLDLTYRVKKNLVRVSKPALETKIYSFQYVNLRRVGSSSTSAQIGAAVGGVASGSIAGATTGTVGGSSATARGGTSGQTTVTTSSDTDLWKNIEKGVKNLLSPEGKVAVDKQGGNILVTDFPKFLNRVASFLESMEGSVQRQVFIEAKIVEVVLTGDYRFGIDWSAVAKAGALRGGAFGGKIFGQRLAPDTGDFQVGVTSTDFETLLTVLSTQGEVNVLSSPKLATLNNQTAVIRSATDDVFFLVETERIPTQDGFQSVDTITPRTVTIGVVLSITPQVSSDGSVILHVRPTVSNRSGDATINRDGTAITVPILDVREADVIVRARDGQVVVIGGLMQERKSDEERKVPILGDLPGIGHLFRSIAQKRTKSELVVLLRPTVMVGKKIDEITSQELGRLERTKGRSPW